METKPSSTPAAGRILIVDDHPNTATTLARAISQLGAQLEIITAENGERALELVRDQAVDILITDLVMPGMTGLELIERMQAHPCGRPGYIALVTAYDVPGLKETARRLKVNEVINKPVRPERICQIVSKAIEQLGVAIPDIQMPQGTPPMRILVADDHPDNIALLSRYLGGEGYICLSASDGVDTLEKARSEMPDLILLDVNMPVKDGFEALQEIRKDAAIGHIPVIILTAARLEPMDLQYALSIGADDYITKPFDRRELLARIRTRLRVKETEDYIRRRNKELNLLPEIGRELSARLDIDELIDLVLRRTVETLGALMGHILLQTPAGLQHRSHRVSSAGPAAGDLPPAAMHDLLASVFETRQGFLVSDTQKDTRWSALAGEAARAMVVVPMLGRLNLLGALILVHEQTGYFQLEHKLLLQAIASQAAIAVENARLYAGMAGTGRRSGPVLYGPIQAAMLFDPQGRLIWMNPQADGSTGTPLLSPGASLSELARFAPLVRLLEDARTSGQARTGEFAWPDGHTRIASLAPMQHGGHLALLFAPAGADGKA